MGITCANVQGDWQIPFKNRVMFDTNKGVSVRVHLLNFSAHFRPHSIGFPTQGSLDFLIPENVWNGTTRGGDVRRSSSNPTFACYHMLRMQPTTEDVVHTSDRPHHSGQRRPRTTAPPSGPCVGAKPPLGSLLSSMWNSYWRRQVAKDCRWERMP